MALYPLPPTTDFVTTGETKGTFKGALSGLRAFLNSLLGADGAQATALTALGALLNETLAKTTAYMVTAADRGKLIDCNGTFDLTIDAIATLSPGGAGFSFVVRNGGTGSITINPNLSETINGTATFVLGPKESCAVTADDSGASWIAVLVGSGGSAGMVVHFAMSTPPSGWLKANGAAVSRTNYAALFAAIGTTFGIGDGATTFNLPDLRGEFLRGLDDGRGVDSGRALGTWQGSQMTSHTHSLIADQTLGGTGNGSNSVQGIPTTNVTPVVATSAAGGTNNSGENRPRNIAMLACIKY